MSTRYPRATHELASWARANGVTVAEARHRFAQYVVLCAIASVGPLQESLVFKGGNALDFVWQPNRSTVDLDFSLDMETHAFEPGEESIRALLSRGLQGVSARFGGVLTVNSVRQQPPGAHRAFASFAARIGYALSDEPRLVARMEQGERSRRMLPIEISLNEPIGDSTGITIDERFAQLRVCTLEDIVAEKLRSLLQQPIRNRHRRQDVLDIAVIVRHHPALDRNQVAAHLILKSNARSIRAVKSAYRVPDIAERARVDYAALADTTRVLFIPFDEAFVEVLRLVDELAIPDI